MEQRDLDKMRYLCLCVTDMCEKRLNKGQGGQVCKWFFFLLFFCLMVSHIPVCCY